MPRKRTKTVAVPDMSEMVFSGPGSRLRFARENQKISLDEVAKYLRLSTQRIAEIENDDYRHTGSSTFARGYLRTYARFLGLPDQDILQEYDQMNLGETIESRKPTLLFDKDTVKHRGFTGNSSRWPLYLILAVVILIVASVIYIHEKDKRMLKTITPAPTAAPATQPIAPAANVQLPNTQSVPLPIQTINTDTPQPAKTN